MGNGQFLDDFPMKTSIYKGFSMAMLNNQRVYIYIIYIYMHYTLEYKMYPVIFVTFRKAKLHQYLIPWQVIFDIACIKGA